jgi:thioredoxin-related protein
MAQVRQQRAPLLILFSTPGCPFCREVRRGYLAPRVAEQAAQPAPTLLIREVDITSRAPLIDLQGRRTTQAEFASRLNVRVVPVVALFDDRARLLGDPLVGIDRAGFYETYLARAIEAAERRLRS